MKVKTADTYYTRMKGLLGTKRHSLDFDVMHIVPCRGVHTFGMKYEIDIAYLDVAGEVLKAQRGVVPNRICSSPEGTHSILERPSSRLPWLMRGDVIFAGRHLSRLEKRRQNSKFVDVTKEYL